MGRTKKIVNEETMKGNRINDMQDILFKTLERLSDDKKLKENADQEIKRCNAVAKVSQTIINGVKTNINVMQMAEKREMTVDEINTVLGLSKKNENKNK